MNQQKGMNHFFLGSRSDIYIYIYVYIILENKKMDSKFDHFY